jgi:hypothetical protein
MQPSWTSDTSLPPEVASALIAQCASLLQRIVTVERALAGQEWWLLGRAVPEAGQVAEVASLLAVARGELEQALDEQFNWRIPVFERDAPAVEDEPAALTHDLAWARERQSEAAGLLRMLAKVLPNMWSFADQLRANAADAFIPSAALGALGIAQDRLREAIETLREQES